jgi:hypothetical protein
VTRRYRIPGLKSAGGELLWYINGDGNWTPVEGTPGDGLAPVISGDVLVWGSVLTSGVNVIDDLTDVVITSPTTGQALVYSGGVWVNATPAGVSVSLDDLLDVVVTSPTAGQTLVYSSGVWVNGSAASSYTDEQAQDAVGTILTDSTTIDFTYNDGANTITAIVKAGSIGPSELASTAVTPGSYTNASITVDADGRLTAASSGSTTTGTRTSTTITTATLAASGQETGSFTLSKASVLVRAVSILNRQARIRLYGTSAARDADVARPSSTSAVSGSASTGTGLLAELVLSSSESYGINLSPVAVLANPADPSVTTLYYTLDNLTTGSVPVAVTLYHTPIET